MRDYFGRNNFGPRFLDDKISFEQGVQRAKNIIKKEAIQYEQLEPFFGSETIKVDRARVANAEEQFRQGKQIDAYGSNCGTIFEAILHLRLKKNDWITDSTDEAKRTNPVDDFFNHIDELVGLENEKKDKKIFFAIDALTVGGGPLNVGIEKKMDRIQDEIVSGQLPKIKYFLDEKTGEVGKKDVPRIVIAADIKTVQELNELWMEGDKEKLAKHPLQIQMLEQIIEEAGIFSSFAKRKGKDEIAKKYDEIRAETKRRLSKITKHIYTDWNDNGSSVVSNALYPFKQINMK